MTRSRLLGSLLAATTLTLMPAPARADVESWNAFEARVPLERPAGWAPSALRVVTSSRFSGRHEGLWLVNMRVGPLFTPTPWLLLGVHASAYAEQTEAGVFRPQQRLELEPNLHRTFGDWLVNDRNRLEWRHTPTDSWFRYRNQVRVTYQPQGWSWWPMASEELAWDLRPFNLAQSRFTLGFWRVVNKGTRGSIEYMWRLRPDGSGWAHDHVLVTGLLFAPDLGQVAGAPQASPD